MDFTVTRRLLHEAIMINEYTAPTHCGTATTGDSHATHRGELQHSSGIHVAMASTSYPRLRAGQDDVQLTIDIFWIG
jgi:hypothetical protein